MSAFWEHVVVTARPSPCPPQVLWVSCLEMGACIRE